MMKEPFVNIERLVGGESPSIGLGCQRCAFLSVCGGTTAGFDCLTECCNSPRTCRIACPKSLQLGALIADGGGWDRTNAEVRQNRVPTLPLYIPMIQHPYGRLREIAEPLVAIPLKSVVAILRHIPGITSEEFRRAFLISKTAKVIVVSVAKDPFLEGFWRNMGAENFPNRLQKLDLEHITSPNFSFSQNLPRTESLTNRSRIVKSSEQLSAAGLSVIPHLNATNANDWMFWTSFLREHREISVVAKEFQTGLKIKEVARHHVQRLDILQNDIGRKLTVLAIGGRGVIDELSLLSSVSIIDSTPFMKAIKRHVLLPGKNEFELLRGKHIDFHLRSNISEYRKRLQELRVESIQRTLLIPALCLEEPRRAVKSELQPSLFPSMYLESA